jgi:hypothetical protein
VVPKTKRSLKPKRRTRVSASKKKAKPGVRG